MREFQVLFDDGEPSAIQHPAYAPYGRLGFPAPPADRPWIYSNFVQSLDGIVSLKGKHATGADISHSREDRWLMDLLRAHADAILLGVNTLVEETRAMQQRDPKSRGPVYCIEDAQSRDLRQKLGRGRETNIFVTGAAALDLGDFKVFDGGNVDTIILSTPTGCARLAEKKTHPQVRVINVGEGAFVDLPRAMRLLREQLGIGHLLCEGGPTLYGWMARFDLIDEKFLTVSPVEVGQTIPKEQEPSDAERANPPKMRPTVFGAPGFTAEQIAWWRWVSCRKVADHQFNRYRRRR